MSSLPNVHPFLVHFPIALFMTAVTCDVALVSFARRTWLDRAAVLLYVAAAFLGSGAALSGKLAANAFERDLSPTVNEAVAQHGDWAFAALVLLFVTAGLRVEARWRDRAEPTPRRHRVRMAALVVALASVAVLFQTAIRGGALVYRLGVGVESHGIIPSGGESR